MDKPIIEITIGDPSGAGTEVSLKALMYDEIWNECNPKIRFWKN